MKPWVAGLLCAICMLSYQTTAYGDETDDNHNIFVELGLENLNNSVERDYPTVVAVIDTGLNPSSFDFKSQILEDEDVQDENGHGTLMASIIDQVANYGLEQSSISLLPIKALDQDGNPFSPVGG